MPVTDITVSALADLLAARAGAGRIVVAIAGAPGSGKSTIATDLSAAIDKRAPGMAALLAMDGYHYDDRLLEKLGRGARKGAPDTFDVAGYAHMLARLRENGEDAIAVPEFDRAIEIARAGARLIPQAARVIVTEGNYLLLRRPPWADLRSLFDVTVFVETEEETLRARLEERWRGYGYPPGEIRAKVEGNDMANARLVIAESGEADYRIRT